MEEGEVVVGFAVAAGGDAAFCFQPGVGAFDRPAVTGLWVGGAKASFFSAPDFACGSAGGDRLVFAAWLADPWLDAAGEEGVFEFVRGVAAVGPELAGLDPALGEEVEQRQQMSTLVFVAGREPDASGAPLASTAR